MRHTDIVIAGGGLAGSTAAAMLARAGIDVVLVDPHEVYPPDLRCEKLDGTQVDILRRTGLADAVLRGRHARRRSPGSRASAAWSRKRPGDQYGILYDTLVNTIRAAIPPGAEFIHAKVTAHRDQRGPADASRCRPASEISARLVVLANGSTSACATRSA